MTKQEQITHKQIAQCLYIYKIMQFIKIIIYGSD